MFSYAKDKPKMRDKAVTNHTSDKNLYLQYDTLL